MANGTTEIRTYNFWVMVTPAEDMPGTWVAHCLDVDVVTFADSPRRAMTMAAEAVNMVVCDDLNVGHDPLERDAPEEYWHTLLDTIRKGEPVPPDADIDAVEQLGFKRLAAALIVTVKRNLIPMVEVAVPSGHERRQPSYRLPAAAMSAQM